MSTFVFDTDECSGEELELHQASALLDAMRGYGYLACEDMLMRLDVDGYIDLTDEHGEFFIRRLA